ncbi:MAG: 2-oxoacid:acceptor oxidoreductase family protein [Patescibacteria group bacterium]|jgi:2-oxoacid:acceptor oxidoreductase gamma subunit (pyruvate/2-ketoisovalerate family)
MIQIRLHGRGGQGVVTAAELIAIAAYEDGKQAQAFPSFGVERTGAPIQAFARIDDKPIRTREQVYRPDILIILDSTLLGMNLAADCEKNIMVIVNTSQPIKDLKMTFGKEKKPIPEKNIFAADASKIAIEILGRNLANTTILGLLAKTGNTISIDGLKKAIKTKFEEKGKEIVNKNIQAIEKIYKQ